MFLDYSYLLDSIATFFKSVFFASLLVYLKIFSIVLSLFILVAIIWVIRKTKKLNEEIGYLTKRKEDGKKYDIEKKDFSIKWEKIKLRLEKKEEAELKLAIIEADNLFDELIKLMGVYGADMGERLMKLNSNQVKNINDIWEAHKLRNQIAHSSSHRLDYNTAQRVIKIYEKAFLELEAID